MRFGRVSINYFSPLLLPACIALSMGAAAEDTKCPKGLQPYANRCISQYMADYVSCVEASGGNHDEISLEISNAQGGKTSASASGSGGNLAVHGEGALALSKDSEAALQQKFREKWGNQGMESCLKALKKPAPAPAPKKQQPQQQPTAQITQQGPGSALSFNQQGGITAGTVNLNQPLPPKITWSQESLRPGKGLDKIKPHTTWGREPDADFMQTLFNNPGVLVTITLDGAWSANFQAECDKPCYPIEVNVPEAGAWNASRTTNMYNQEIVTTRLLMPSPLPSNSPVQWVIRSRTSDTVSVTKVELIPY